MSRTLSSTGHFLRQANTNAHERHVKNIEQVLVGRKNAQEFGRLGNYVDTPSQTSHRAGPRCHTLKTTEPKATHVHKLGAAETHTNRK